MRTLRQIATITLTAPLALAASAVLADEYEVDGMIESVDAEDRTLTVELEETGDVVTYSVSEDTDISIYGNIGRQFDELHSGQSVTLEFDDEEMFQDWIVLHVITVS